MVLILLALAGCARLPTVHTTPNQVAEAPIDPAQVAALQADIAALAATVNDQEAWDVSECAFRSASEMAAKCRLVRPPILHNLLVNLGLRDQGLCHHFAADLEVQLTSLALTTLSARWAIARAGTWREHNAIVITAKDAAFEQGMVLDAWRHSGKLYWGPVATDRYPWKEGFLNESTPAP